MRRLIVENALRIYVDEGYENLSLRKVADSIEYSVGTIYLYYKNKDELYLEMHNLAFDSLFEAFDNLIHTPDPYQRIEQMTEAYINFAFNNPELYHLMFIMKEPTNYEEQKGEWHLGTKVFRILLTTIQEAMEIGEMKKLDPSLITFMTWSAVHGMVSLYLCNRLSPYKDIDKKMLIMGATKTIFGLLKG